MTPQGEAIRESLQEMFRKARERKLWFHSLYQDVWFSPDELDQMHEQGRFLWGPVNWKLRSPSEKLDELEREAERLLQRIKDFQKRMQESA